MWHAARIAGISASREKIQIHVYVCMYVACSTCTVFSSTGNFMCMYAPNSAFYFHVYVYIYIYIYIHTHTQRSTNGISKHKTHSKDPNNVYTYVYIHTQENMYIYIYIYICTHITFYLRYIEARDTLERPKQCLLVYMNVHFLQVRTCSHFDTAAPTTHLCIHACMYDVYMYVCMYICVCMYVCMYIYIYIYIYTHTHA